MSDSTEERYMRAARYLSGEATPEERSAFEAWLDHAPANRTWFESIRLLWDRSDEPRDRIDVDAAWAHLQRRIAPHSRRSPERSPVRRQRRFQPFQAAMIAAMLIAVVGLAWWLADGQLDPANPASEERIVEAAQGEQVDVRLSDGSRITLAPLSTLTLPAGFGSEHRSVRLDGEALFDVEVDTDLPFTIESERGTVRVLGTRFVVRDHAYSAEPYEVAVDQGIVETEAGGLSVRMTAGEAARLLDGELQVSAIEDPDVHFGWTEGRLVFRDAEMQHVAASLERWYGLSIAFSGASLKHRRITATFTGTAPDDVMHVIARTIDARLERDGDTYRIVAAQR